MSETTGKIRPDYLPPGYTAGGHCRCGIALPDVLDTGTPYEFCSKRCHDAANQQPPICEILGVLDEAVNAIALIPTKHATAPQCRALQLCRDMMDTLLATGEAVTS